MDELLNFKEACDFLKIGEKALLKILAEEEIPARKIGGKWIFSKNALIQWVSAGNSKNYSNIKANEENEID